MFYVAVVCPPSGVVVPDGYELTNRERFVLAGRLVGIPITVQHANVAQRMSTIPRGTALVPALMQTKLDSCGMVISAWVACDGSLMAAFSVHANCTSIIYLIRMQHLAFVSLTHVVETSAPVELSLCSNPARPGSKIVHASDSLKDVYEYKARNELAYIASSATMEAETKTAPSPLQVALNSLSDEQRTLIEARMTTMMTAVDEARKKEQEAASKYEGILKTSQVDEKLLQQHLEYMYSFLSEEDKALYCVGNVGKGEPDPTFDALKAAPASVVHTMSNLIKCASAKMAHNARNRSSQAVAEMQKPAQPKRKAEPTDELNVHAAAANNVDVPPVSALERALAHQFC